MNTKIKRYLPFLLTLFIILIDQVSKALIVHFIPEGHLGLSLFNSWLEIVHVRNDAVAFSVGSELPVTVKYLLFIVVPLVVMIYLAYVVASRRYDKELTYFQRWCFAGVLGGGLGNIIDRVFRSLRVVDFVSTDLNGFLGLDRFPTWNLADASVVISVILLLFSFAFAHGKKTKDDENGKKD